MSMHKVDHAVFTLERHYDAPTANWRADATMQ